MTVGMGLRILVQTAIFLIVARVLGVADYGAYSAILALAGTLGSFGGLGIQAIMVRDVSRHPECFPTSWGDTLAAIILSAPILFVAYLALAWAVLPASVSPGIVLLIGLAELIFMPIAIAAINAYQGHERIGRASRLVLAPVIPRLVGALVLLALVPWLPEDQRLLAWGALYAIATLLAAGYAWQLVTQDLGAASRPSGSRLWTKLSEGWPFALGNVAVKLYADIDKTLLARLATLEVAGAYSAGYRVVDFATVPVFSLLIAAAPRFFREGENGVRHAARYAWRILPLPLIATLFISVILYFMADFLPLLLGSSYSAAVPVLQWLAWLPVVSLPRLFLQTSLGTGDRQHQAVAILALGAGINIVLNLWLIPTWSWRGAVVATYAAEIVMLCAMILAVHGPERGNHPLKI